MNTMMLLLKIKWDNAGKTVNMVTGTQHQINLAINIVFYCYLIFADTGWDNIALWKWIKA